MAALREDLAALREEVRAGFGSIENSNFNVDTMTRALCTQDGVNLSQLRLRTPAVPLFEDESAGPSAVTVASTTSASSPRLHMGRLSIGPPSAPPTPTEGKTSRTRISTRY